MWWLFIPGLLVAGVAGAYLFSRAGFFGDRIIVFHTSIPDHRDIRAYLPSGWSVYFVDTAQDVLNVIEQHARISRFIIVSHGSADWFLDRNLTSELLGQALGPRLTLDSIVGLAGCSAGRSPSEPSDWSSPHLYRDGGADSYAGHLRDWALHFGAPRSAEIRAHSIWGHTTANPTGRVFYLSEPGASGQTIKPTKVSNGEWVARFQGDEATRWILGLS